LPTPTVNMKDLLTSGVHFGHQTRRWNPKMKPYIFGERGGIYIIDLQKTTVLIDEAYAFLRTATGRGGAVLFVGTKKQCQDAIKAEAERVGQPYVCNRWLGGLLTNFATLSKRIKRLHELRKLVEDGSLDLLPTREAMSLRADLAKLETNLGGVAAMERLPAAVFVVDPRKEAIVVKEARKLGIPIVALVDTNCDPDEVDYLIPGNDDAIRSCALIIKVVADAVAEGRQKVAEDEFKAAQVRAEAEKAAVEAAAVEAARAAEAAETEAARQAQEAARAAAEAPAPAAPAPSAPAVAAEPAAPSEAVAPAAEAAPAPEAPPEPVEEVAAEVAEPEKPPKAAKRTKAAKPAAPAKRATKAKPVEKKAGTAAKTAKKTDAPAAKPAAVKKVAKKATTSPAEDAAATEEGDA
jgi:small subunit ribosomal protein S2